MLFITANLSIPDDDIEITAVRAQGPGGQNVNKVSSAVHLRFDIKHSSLPESNKQKLLALRDQRITKEGVIVIKAQSFRSFDKNRLDARARLAELIKSAVSVRKMRKATKPTKTARLKRLESKTHRAKLKSNRSKVSDY